jgi:simple sugar transport system substrate-binding protein
MKISTLLKSSAFAVAALSMVGVAAPASAQDGKAITTVVKISGIPWFDRMETGVNKFAEQNPEMDIRQVGPATADSAQQLQIVQDLVATGVDALAVVPMDPDILEGILGRAMDRGTIIVTHEADNQANTHADIEAFDNADYGAALNERLAQCMGGEGKWTTFVGSLGSRTHMQWVGAGEENAKKYPGMELVDPNNESFDDANGTYEKAKEILRKHPDIKGFQTSAGNDVRCRSCDRRSRSGWQGLPGRYRSSEPVGSVSGFRCHHRDRFLGSAESRHGDECGREIHARRQGNYRRYGSWC